MQGIYQIKNIVNEKCCIGSSSNIGVRWKQHRSDLGNSRHHCGHLQRAWNKYGRDSFEFEMLLYWKDADSLLWIEQWYLDNWEPEYNIATSAFSLRRGVKHTEEAKRKMTNTRTGRKYSEKHRANIGKANKGKRLGYKNSRETIQKMSGEAHPNSRLKKCEVLEIRRLYTTHSITQVMLGKMFGVSNKTINHIIKNRRWDI